MSDRWHLLASALRGVIAQRLLERADGKGRNAAVEVRINSPKVCNCILDPEREAALERIVAEGEYHGTQTFDRALFGLFKDGLVSLRDALAVASQPEDLRVALQQAGLSPAYQPTSYRRLVRWDLTWGRRVGSLYAPTVDPQDTGSHPRRDAAAG